MPRFISEPRPLDAGTLRIIPLGGLGEIGRNMTVFEFDGRLLIVDCGVLFPEETQPGVDLILPDFTPIRDRLDDIVGIVLTHGHEDHIGAVPYLLRLRSDITLYGSTLTLALIEAKLHEHKIRPEVKRVDSGQRLNVGPFDLEFVAVNHSIPDALAVAIRTPAGLVLGTGDFKMDQLPLDGRLTDLRAFARQIKCRISAKKTAAYNNKIKPCVHKAKVMVWAMSRTNNISIFLQKKGFRCLKYERLRF
jgi:ribonuclease J